MLNAVFPRLGDDAAQQLMADAVATMTGIDHNAFNQHPRNLRQVHNHQTGCADDGALALQATKTWVLRLCGAAPPAP